MNGFSSADMSTAAANGHADGYQAGRADAAKAMARQTMATCPRDGTVVLLHWGEDHVSPGWWSAPCAPVQNGDGTWPSDTGGFPWAFFDLRDGDAFVNHAVDTAYGPTHWSVYAAHVAAAPTTEDSSVVRISTPAAPGIDVDQLLPHTHVVIEKMQDVMAVHGFTVPVRVISDAFRTTLLCQQDGKIDASPKGGIHPDDAAVDAFAAEMKTKLAEARAKGRGGWQNDELGMQQRLSDMLRDHVEKGDPRDVANFCMFLHQRGEGIRPKGGSDAHMAATVMDYMTRTGNLSLTWGDMAALSQQATSAEVGA